MIELPWRRRTSPRPYSKREPAPPLVIEPHWALYLWEGPSEEDPFPTDLDAWMRLAPPHRAGCAADTESALSWAQEKLSHKWPHVGHQLPGTRLDDVHNELRTRLGRDGQAVLDLDTDHGLQWVVGVLGTPLCLSPSTCHSQPPQV